MPKYDPTARPKTKADKEKERREKEQAQVIKPSQRDPRHVTDPLAYGNRYDPVRDAQPVPELNKKKPSVVDTLLSGIKGAASRAEKDHYSGYNVDDVTNANYNKGKKPESGGKKPERRTPSYMTSSGWTDEVKSYTPEKPEKPQKPTKSQQWAEDLSADAQRTEQRETRKAEAKKPVSPVDALVPKPSQTNSQDQTRLTDTATGNRSEWFPEMSAPEEKTVVPPAPSGYAAFSQDEEADAGVEEQPDKPKQTGTAPANTALDDYLSEQKALRQASDPERQALASAAAEAQAAFEKLDSQDKTWWGPMDWDSYSRAQAAAGVAQRKLEQYDIAAGRGITASGLQAEAANAPEGFAPDPNTDWTEAAREKAKEELKDDRDALWKEYSELQQQIAEGNFKPEDAERLKEMETQLGEMNDQISTMQRADVDPVKAVGLGIYSGLEKGGYGVTQALDWLGGEKSLPWEVFKEVGTLFGADLEGKNPITKLKEKGKEEVAYWSGRAAEESAGNDTLENVTQHAENIAQSAPFIVLNLMTMGGAGGAAASTEGLEYISTLFESPGMQGISTMAAQGIKTLASNPSAQYSFATTFGSSYDEALEDGASPAEATMYAALNGVWNAMIEVGGSDEALGGMQALPANIREAMANGDRSALLDYIKSIAGEVNEEEWQGFIERGLKSLYQDVALYSAEDPNAIINPATIWDTAKNAAIDTAFLAGGQTAIQYGLSQAGQQNAAPLDPTQALAEQVTGQAAPVEGLSAEDQRAEQRTQRQQTPDEILAEAATPKAEEERKTSGEERAEERAPEAPQEEAPVEETPAEEAPPEEETPAEKQPTPEEMGDKQQERKPETPAEILAAEASKKGKAAEAPSEAAESTEGEDRESVPPSTQESSSEAQEELNNGSRSEEDAQQRKQERIAAADEQTRTETEALRTEFEQDPVNVQRFQDGQGTYSQYDTQTRLSVLQYLFPEEDYYLSAGNIVKGRQTTASGNFNSTTGQSTTFGDRRTGSDFRRPRATSPTSNIPGPMPSQNSFDPQTVKPGDKLTHNAWGDVTVVGVENGRVQVELADGEVKTVLQDRMGDKFTPVQSTAESGTIDTSSDAYTSQNGGQQDVHRHGQHKQGRQVDTRAESYFGRSAVEFDAETDEQRRNVETVKRIAGEKTQVRFVDADSTEANGCWGLTIYNDDGATTVLLRTGHPKGAIGEKVAAVHEAVHAAFDRVFGHKSNYSASSNLFESFKAAHPELADAADSYLLKVSKIVLAKKGGAFGLPPFDPNAKNADAVAAYAMKKNPDFCGASCNEFFAYMASGSVNSKSDDAADVVSAMQRAAQEMLMDGRIVDPGMFDDAPSHIDFYNTPSTSNASTYENLDPGANKSWADSLTAQEPPAENDTGERPDDDMTPLNEQSRERDEERREKQKAETKKKLGKDNYDRMNKALEKLDAWDKEYTERYGETAKDENGHDIVDDDLNETKTSAVHELATRVRSMLEGEESVQSFAEYYESLRPAEGETNQTDANYLYDGALAEMLNQLADAERALNLSEKGSPADGDVAREEFAKASEAFAGSLETRLGRLEEQFKNRTKANEEITSHAKGEKTGRKNSLDRLKKRFWETQMRVDTFFKMLGGFSEKSKVMNDLAQRGADSTIKRNNVRNSGYEFFHDLSTNPETSKAWKDIESGKTKGNVDIPGLGKASMNYELAMLKTLMTNGALDHIARFGAQFVNEADYYKGYNNNGRGETESYQAQHRLTRDMLDQMAKENLQAANELAERTGGKGKKINGKAIYDEKIRILKELRSELMKDVSSNEVALAGYNASIEAMKYLANEINDVTLRLYGVAKALQGSNYWPMQVIGRGNNLQFLNNNAFTMEEASYLQHRKGGSGALQINPFAEVMSSYIDRASKFVGFGELNSDLMMMSKEIGVGYGKHDSEKQSIQSTIQKQAGSSAAKWMTRYMETLNGTAKHPSKLGSMLRSNLASSSLTLNPGVALKQSPSYFNAAGIVDLDILIKNRLITLGALRSAKSYDSNPLIQEINKRTGILESRKSGTVVLGEQDGRAMFGKLKKLLPNWITNRDVSTVSNLALACAEQVKRNNPGIDTKSDAFYEQTAKLLEQVVIKSQPVYDAEFRPDYLRSDNEIVRMNSMFRTQHSQNLNQLMQAYGELEAARREGGDVKAAEKKRNQVVAGYAMSQVAFTILSSAARVLLHKTKDYEDEEGNIDLGKVAKRVGLDFLTTAGGVVWFGDTLSKMAIDAATGLYAKATGKKDAATSEFFSMSDNTISVIDDVIGSTIKVFQNPTPKTIKSEVFDLAQSVGLPARNFYNILNSAFMYGTDAFRKNPGNYDDAIDMWMTESKKSDTTRAKDTTEAAVKAFKKGDAEKGNTLLATLDYSNKDVASAVKKAAGDAYVRGDIDEKTYRKILRDTAGAAAEAEVKAAEAAFKAKEIDGKTYAEILKNAGKADDAAINKAVHSKDIDKTIAALTEQDPKKYEALIKNIDEAKENSLTGTSKSNAAARLILDAAMSKDGRTAFMEKYTSSGYFKAYEAASVGYKAEKVIEVLANIDENKDDQFTQEELYAYFKDTGHSEIVRAVWRANGWKTSFDDYRKQKAKTAEYDKVAGENESYEFGEAEKKLKELKSGNTMHIQTGGGDPAMFKIIGGMGLSAKDTDTVVDKYVSSKTKTNYHVLRDGGYEPAKAMELLTAVDTDGKGTLSQKEMWAYYKEHKDDEAVIEALWNAQGYKKDWKTYKKKQK